MLSSRFSRLFAELISRWDTWWRAPRDPDQVAQLARARFALEDARSAISAERDRISVRDSGPPVRTSVSADDLARLAVRGVGGQQA